MGVFTKQFVRTNKLISKGILKGVLWVCFLIPSLQGFSQSASTSVYWSSGWCTICGGSSYSCNPPWSGSGNWNNGIRCFTDPIPAGNVMTGVCVTVYKADCDYGTLCTSINGTTVSCQPPIGDCWCGNCWPQTYCTGVIPGYSYGGSNCLQISISGGSGYQAVCVSSATITFTYQPACTQSSGPSSASASPNPTCGGSTTLSVGGGSLGTGASWKWYAGGCGGAFVGTGSSINVSPSSTTTYFVRAEGNCNTTGCASVTVNVNSQSTAPAAATASPNPLCGGGSTTLSVVGGSLGTGASWKWYAGSCGGSYVGSGSSISVSPGSTTAYFVRAEGTCNTTSCASVTVIAGSSSSPPTLITASSNPTCGGSTTLTQIGGSLGIGASYLWYSGSCGGNFIGTGSSITVSPSSTTTYYVLASGTCNVTPCASLTINVGSAPVANASPSTQSVCSGGTTSIVLGSSIPGTSFSWTVSQNGVSGATPSNGSIISQTLNTTGNTTGTVVYTVTPTAGGCVGNPISVTVVVNPVPSATALPSTQIICSGGITSISLTSNVSVTSYSWTVAQSGASGAAPGAGSSIVQTIVATGVNPGIAVYTITPSTVSCTGSPITATVTINPVPVATASPATQTVCSGQSTAILLNSNIAGTVFNWTANSVGVSGASAGSGANISQTLSATGSSPGTVTYTVTPSVGTCIGIPIQVTITVNPSPTVVPTPSAQTVCSGNASNIFLSSNLPGTTFTWTVAQNGVSGAAPGNGPSINQTLTATGSTLGTAVYTVTPTASGGGCSGTPVNITITVNPIPTVTATPPSQTICSGSVTAISLTSNVGGASFAWTISQSNVTGGSPSSGATIAQTLTNTGSTAGTAVYTVTPSASGCNGTPLTINVQIDRVPVASATPTTQTICSGDATNIALSSDIPGTTFAWTISQTGTTGASAGNGNAITQAIAATGTTAGTVTYTIIPTFGNCPGQPITVTITVNPKPIVTATPPSQSICSGSTTAIALSSNISGTTFTWTVTQTGVTGATSGNGNSIAQTLTLTGSTSGSVVYTVTPSASNGCIGLASTIVVNVNKQDNPTFNYSNSTYCQTEPNPTPAITGLAGGTFTATPVGLVFVDIHSGEINLSGSTVGTYVITYTTNGPCPAISTVNVTIVTLPSSAFSYVPTPICQYSTNLAPTFPSGASAGVFTATPVGLAFVNPATGVIDLATSVPGTYTVKNTIAPGPCPGDADSVTIVINPAPVVTATPSSQSLCSGSTTGIALTSSIPGSTFAWTVSQTGVSGASPNNGSSIAQTLSTTGNITGAAVYSVIPTAPSGCPGQPLVVSVTVNPVPTITATPTSQSICSGSTANIALASNVTGVLFTWTIVETGVSGGSLGSGLSIAQTLITTNPVAGNAIYTITPSANGCNGTPLLDTVLVNPVPVATATPSVPTICSGDTTAIALTADVAGTTFVWTYNQTNASGAADGNGTSINQTLTATTVNTGIVVYSVVPGIAGCSGTPVTATVTVNPRPVLIATPPFQSLCSFGTTSIALTSNVFGTTYDWTVLQTNVTGGANGSASNIFQTLSTTGVVSGTAIYTITPKANGCNGTPLNDTVTVYPVPVVTATPTSQTFCSGGTTSIALTSSVAGTTFVWTTVETGVTGAAMGTGANIIDTITTTSITDGIAAYTITPSAAGSCSGTPISVTVTVKPVPVLTAVPSPTTICSGDTTLIALVSNIPGTAFIWAVNQSGATGAFASTGNTITQTLTATGNTPGLVKYIVTSSFNSCSSVPDTINVTVNPRPVVTATPSPDTICSLDTTHIVLHSNVAGTTFSWLVAQTNVFGGIAGADSVIQQALTNTSFFAVPGTAIYTITPMAGGCKGTAINETVLVKRTDNAAYAYTSGTYCQSAPNPTPIITGLPGGRFTSSPPGLVLDSLTGTVTTSLSALGSYLLSYTTNGPCPKVNTMTMTITITPSAVFSYANTHYCQYGLNNPNPVFGTGASAGVFTASPAGLVFVHVNTGQIDLSASLPGTYTVTNTIPAGGTCIQVAEVFTVTIDPGPTVTPSSATQTLCSGDTTSFTLTSTMPSTLYDWTIVQNGVSGGSDGNGASISQVLATTSNFSGTAVYIITPHAGGCSGPPITVTETVNPIPSATALPSAQIVCSGGIPLIVLSSTVSGTIFNWTVSQTGVTGGNNGSGILISEPLTATGSTQGTAVYTITPSAGGCSGTPVSVSVHVNPVAIATATPATQTICSGDSTSIVLTGNIPGTSFTWTAAQSGATGAVAGADSIISQVLTSTFGSTPGTVTYTITPSANGCPGPPITAIATVDPRPVVTISPSAQTICSGDATSLSLTSNMSGTTYSWTVTQTGVSGATPGNGSNIVQTLTATDTVYGTVVYSVTPISAGCAGTPVTVTITVNPRPVIHASPTSQTICSGNNTSIALSSNVVGTNFTWTVSQNNVTGATAGGGSIISQTLSATVPGTALYVINPTAGGCTGLPISVPVTVQPALVATALPSNKTICSGSSFSVVFSSNIIGTTYTWSVSQTGVSGALVGSGDTISQTLTSVGPTVGTAVYTVTPHAGSCGGTPIVVSITVNPPPDVIAVPSSQTFCSGGTTSIALSSNVIGTSFAWTVAETGVTGATLGTGNTIAQTLNTTGSGGGMAIYTITPSANGCYGAPHKDTVTVNHLDSAAFFYSSATYCQSGADPTPTITGLPGGTFVSTTPPFSLVVNPSTGTIDLSASATGIYTLSYTTNGICPNTVSINMNIRSTDPSASFSYLGSPFCQFGPNPTPIYGAGASPGYYTASPAGLVFVHVNTGEIDLAHSAAGTYTITNTIPPSGSCAGAIATYSITIDPAPVVTATPAALTICAGSTTSIVLTSSLPGTTYTWTVLENGVTGAVAGAGDTIAHTLYTSGLVSGYAVYTITPFSGNCLGQPITVVVHVDPCPIGTAIPSTQAICSGGTTSISLSSNILGTVFNWTVTQVGVTGAVNGTGDGIAQTLTTTGDSVGTVTYLVSLTANGCNGIPIPITVTVNPIPSVHATPTSQIICSGDSAMIVLSSNVPGTNFAWTVSQLGVTGGASGNGDTIINVLTATGQVPGVATYTITPMAPGNCPGLPISDTVTVRPAPILTATPTTQIICSGDTSDIILHSTDTSAVFHWTVIQNSVTGAFADTASVIRQVVTATDSIQGTAIYYVVPMDTVTGCSGNPVYVNLQVNPLPVIHASPASQIICTGSTTGIVLSSTVAGTSFSWTVAQNGVTGAVPGSGINIAQTLSVNGITSGTAVYTVTPVSGSCIGDTMSVVVTVNLMDSAQFSYPLSAYCQTGVDPVAVVGGLPGGTFSSSTGLIILDSLTGLIDLSASPVGVHEVKYTTNGQCSDTSITYVAITAAPGTGFHYVDTAFCQNAINPLPILDSAAMAGLFSATPAGLVFVDIHTGEINLDSTALGTYVITNTVTQNGTCGPDSSSITISIVPLVAMATPATQDICSGTSTSVSFSSSLSGTTYSWTVTQVGVTGATPGSDSALNQTLTLTGLTPGTATYIVTPSTPTCIGDTFSVIVNVNPPPLATANPSSQVICSGDTAIVNFTSSNPGSIYSWTIIQGGVAGAVMGIDTMISQVLTATGNDTGSVVYNIIPSVNGCSGSLITAVVDVIPAVNASFMYTSATYCQSGNNPTPSITGLTGGLFTASSSGLVIDSLTGTINLSASTLGVYVVTYTTHSGSCNGASSITMTIGDSNPSAVFTYSTPTFCRNGSNPSPIFPTGASAGIFSASPSGLVFVHVNTGEIDLSASAPGTYIITNYIPASGSCLSAITATTITITSSDNASFVYTSATYCTSGNNPTPSITGLPGGVFTASPTGLVFDSLSGTINLDSSALGIYTLSYTTNGTCQATSSITMTITDTTPSTSFGYVGSPYCQNGFNPHPVYGIGASAGIYSASPPGLTFVHVNTGEIDLSASTPGTYIVTNTIPASGSCLASASSDTIVINASDNASFVYSSATYCNSGTNPTPSILGLSGGTFTATPTGLVLNDSTGTINLSASQLGSYTLTYTTHGSCQNSSSITMTITDTTAVASFSYPASPFCQGGNNPTPTYNSGGSAGIFSATPTGLSFVNLNTGEINLLQSSPGTYVVTNTIPANGNCLAASASDTIIITPLDNASFVYTSATYCNSGANPTPIITGVTGGIFTSIPVGLALDSLTGTINLAASTLGSYTLIYSVSGVCANSISILMTITDTTPSATFTYSTSSFCQGGVNPYVVFSPGSSAGVFTASPSGLVFVHVNTGEVDVAASAPGTYIVSNNILASGNCVAANSSTVLVINGAPVITANPVNETICTGSPTSIALTSSIPGTVFQWHVNQNGVSGGSSGNGAAISQTLTTTTFNHGVATYFVSGSSNGCAGDSIIVSVGVSPLPSVNNLGMIINAANCVDSGGAILGLIVPQGQSPMTMVWTNANGDTVSTGSSDLSNVIPGSYSLTLKDTSECSINVGPFVINSTSSVTAAYTADPTTGQTPLTVNFTNESLNAVTYLWHFGDTDTSTQTNPIYTIVPTDSFNICLIAYNVNSCTDTACSIIVVDQNSSFVVPNVFTPNGDDVNDVFVIKGVSLKTLDAEIFNRWGQKEFEWHAPSGGWDGRTASGLLCPTGTYFYMIKAEGKDGKKYEEKGSFMLIREGE